MSEGADRRVAIVRNGDEGKVLVGYVILDPAEIPADVVPDLAITPITITPTFAVNEWLLSPRTQVDTRERSPEPPYQHIDPPDADEQMAELVREVLPYLHHAPECSMSKPEGTSCLCSLELTISGMEGKVPGLDIVRCRGCGVHAVNGENDDWAYRESDRQHFCNGCAVARMGGE